MKNKLLSILVIGIMCAPHYLTPYSAFANIKGSISGPSSANLGQTITYSSSVFSLPGITGTDILSVDNGAQFTYFNMSSGSCSASPTLPSSSINISVPAGASCFYQFHTKFNNGGLTTITNTGTFTGPPSPLTTTRNVTVSSLLPPTISATPNIISIPHSDLGAPSSTHNYSLSISNGDGIIQATNLSLVGCSGNWAIVEPSTGNSLLTPTNDDAPSWTSTLQYTYPRTGPISEQCAVMATDAQGSTTSSPVTFTATDSPLTVTSTCETVMIVGKPLSQLKSTDILAPTPFTIDYTLSDADDTTATRTTLGPLTTVNGVVVSGSIPFETNPLTVGVTYTGNYTITPGFTPGTLIEAFTNHNTALSSCRIGPAGSSLYEISINYDDKHDPEDFPIPPTVYYVSEIDEAKRKCKEVAYSSTGAVVGETEYGELIVVGTHGSSENTPSSGETSPADPGFGFDPTAGSDISGSGFSG